MKKEISGKKNRTWLFISVFFIIGIAIYVALQHRKVGVEKSTFIEAANLLSEFSEEERANINSCLSYFQVQDADRYGFSCEIGDTSAIDLYNANAIVSLATLIPGYDLSELSGRMSFLSTVDYDSLDFFNLVYLANISRQLNIEPDYKCLNESLKRFYDDKCKLFYAVNPDDGIHVELVATINVLRGLGDNLDRSWFKIDEGAREALEGYDFLMNTSNTMYNSGGDILCLLGELNLASLADGKMISEWFDYWGQSYESLSMDSLAEALYFSSFAEVRQVFDSQYGRDCIYKYYCSIEQTKLSEIDDLLMLCDVLKKGKQLDNDAVNELLVKKIEDLTKNGLANSEIDIRSTAFGVALAEKTGFDYDKEKVRNYVKDNYATYNDEKTLYDKVELLYYNLMLDQLVNGYDQDYDKDFFQKQINALLSELQHESGNIAADISSARRIVEIVSDLRTFGVDVDLNCNQLCKLRKIIKKFYKDESLRKSALIIDAYIIDEALSLNIIKQSEFMEIYNELIEEGGVRQYIAEEVQPDVCTTYLFFAVLNSKNEYSHIESERKFILSTKLEEGIFSYYRNQSFYDLSTIAYGNSILGYKYGSEDHKKR